MSEDEPIPLEMLLWGYSTGIFPMADHRHGTAQWYSANPRAILPLESFRASHSLRQRIRRGTYEVRVDTAFEDVIRRCAEPRPGHPITWINDQIIGAFVKAHEKGYAHSVEAWGVDPARGAAEDKVLLGGLYGLALGGAFFGESMFSRAPDASKVCLVALVNHLNERGYVLLDVQMNSGHMAQFGTIEISREEYERRLKDAIRLKVSWSEPGDEG